jgi:hypothetical protein
MLISEIEQLIEQESLDEGLRKRISILLQSVTDWPTEIVSTEDLLRELGARIKGEPDEANIRALLLSINFATEAWIAESLDGLVEIFELSPKGVSLASLLNLLEVELGSGSGGQTSAPK